LCDGGHSRVGLPCFDVADRGHADSGHLINRRHAEAIGLTYLT
jgi:hypothetical protein